MVTFEPRKAPTVLSHTAKHTNAIRLKYSTKVRFARIMTNYTDGRRELGLTQSAQSHLYVKSTAKPHAYGSDSVFVCCDFVSLLKKSIIHVIVLCGKTQRLCVSNCACARLRAISDLTNITIHKKQSKSGNFTVICLHTLKKASFVHCIVERNVRSSYRSSRSFGDQFKVFVVTIL